MLEQAIARTHEFQRRLAEANIDVAVLTDESSIAYFAGFWGYLSVEFGRPTFLIIKPDQAPIVITPLMESEMVAAMTWVEDVMTWEDAGQNSWDRVLGQAIVKSGHHSGSAKQSQNIGVELAAMPTIVRNWFDGQNLDRPLNNISSIIGQMRMIKSPDEIMVMRQAGEIAGAMMQAAEDSLGENVPEYEVALAIIAAGTRKAAGFLTDKGWDSFISPMIHNLQIMQSGNDTSMVHRRANVKRVQKGDPVYFCFCNMAQFKQYKLGFDRMFFIHDISDQAVRVQQSAIDAQQAAISAIKPGVTAQSIAEAADAIYHERGYETGYRTGRSIGMSYLEVPELKHGDQTILQAGMTFAVDGGISLDGQLGGRIGDSIVVTETGSEYLTSYSRDILITQ